MTIASGQADEHQHEGLREHQEVAEEHGEAVAVRRARA